MGICGLHQAIKPYLLPVSVAKYAGQRVACDAYAWLHRGACQCAGQLVQEEASSSIPPYVHFCLKMLAMLQHHGVSPVVSGDPGFLYLAGPSPTPRAQLQPAFRGITFHTLATLCSAAGCVRWCQPTSQARRAGSPQGKKSPSTCTGQAWILGAELEVAQLCSGDCL